MFIYRLQIFSLLLFVGIEGSIASPTNAAFSSTIMEEAKTLTEDSIKHDSPQTIDQKEEENRHQWDCTSESNYVQEQLALTSTLLEEGYKITHKQKDLAADEVILVLGKAGSGKTSIVQFLTENPKLQSKKVKAETGEFIIDDGEKIGTSATESFTLYPELVNYNSTINFCDSPGFHDSRSSAHEIVSMDIMKTITKRFKKVKILLLEKYSSLQYGFSKDNFLNTLRHLNEFLVDFDRFREHIVLVATKLQFSYRMTDDAGVVPEFITDEMHIDSILEYLNHTEISLTEKLSQKNSKKTEDFYQKAIRLLQSFQTRDENGKSNRINVFRRPYKSGPLKNMPLLDKNRKSLSETIMNLEYVEVKENDFDFTLSDKAKLYLECLLKLSNDNYKNKINELSFKLKEYVTQKTQNYSSFYQISTELDLLYSALRDLSGNLDETKDYSQFFEKVQSFISDQKIPLQYNYYNNRLQTLEKIEEMLLKFVDTSTVFIPSSWTLPIKHLVKSVESEYEWYKSLIIYIEKLSSYETQKNKTETYSAIFQNTFTVTSNLMAVFMDATGSKNVKQFIDAQADDRRKLEMETITKTLLQKSNITCDANGRLIVKGFLIRLSEINSESLIRFHCNNITLKEVALLAVDSVYLDEDTIDMFQEVNLFIAAPKWHVIGQRQIVLSGRTGMKISENSLMFNGKDGKPGLPGGNGGNFVGIGLQFSNGENLLVESNGGRGGPGSNGGKGERGTRGEDAEKKLKLGIYDKNYTFTKGVETEKLVNSFSSISETQFYASGYHCSSCCSSYKSEINLLRQDGDCGSDGSIGGFGGEAGFGGLAGDQQLVELSDSSQIRFERRNGTEGSRGSMGETGDQGMNGIGMICIHLVTKYSNYESNLKSYWKCVSTDNTTCNTSTGSDKPEQILESQHFTTTGIQLPAPKKSSDSSYYSLDYSILLKRHSSHMIFSKIITDFNQAIGKKFSYDLNGIGMLFFQDNSD
ncbi:uncharacterized protein LOC111059620 [Nilaparvata lugens]|uniref:uncharacterized protein LOC111059620 n=1 Tax=Nilaparvata lugens TaxID=108931 RepID=UPI00193DAAA1|nr:uncharacterized protein LOC111059620 [Nilaparvata lugens]